MKVPIFEKNIGIESYFTNFEGVGGKLRQIPKDFIVKEKSIYPNEVESGKFTIADVTSENWETHNLIRELSKRLNISRKRINFAGTKDKRALTTQVMSFYNVSLEKISNLNIKDVQLDNIYYSNNSVKLGNLIGNSFEILIRDINGDVDDFKVKKIADFINESGGFPNFFGVQRFGTTRPITHIVGKHIVNENLKKAVMTYIANPMKGEGEESYKLRKELEQTNDYANALKSFPKHLSFEKSILNKLVVDSDDYVSALKELPKPLLLMFINAYQSYIFNRIISERLKRKLPLNEAVVGDIILPVRKDSIEEEYIFVKDSNIQKVNKQISKKKAFVSGILIGYEPIFSKGEPGEIEHKVIDEEKINYKDFIMTDMPFLSSTGVRRPIFTYVKNLECKLLKDDLNKNKKLLLLKFDLSKGSYATCLLREFMKSKNVKDY